MRLIVAGLLAAGMISACGQAQDKSRAAPPKTVQAQSIQAPSLKMPPAGKLPTGIAPLAYALQLNIDPSSTSFSGHVAIKVRLNKAMKGFWMHGQGLVVENAVLTRPDGADIAATYQESAEPGVSLVTLAQAAGPGDATLQMDFHAPFNRALDGLYQVKRGEDSYIVSQFEAIAARKAFPSFDEPRFKVPFDIAVTAPKDDVVIANTPQVGEKLLQNGMVRHEFARTKPLPTYLLAFAVGPYDINKWTDIPANAVRTRPLPLRGVTTKGNGKLLDYALKNTGGIVATEEQYFGIPFPYAKLDLIAAPDYAFGAMENPGAIVFAEFLLLMDDHAALRQKRAYASVTAHELAHQWFGDLVTPTWWTDIWLNEAFATWMGNKTLTLWKPDGEFDRATLRGALGAMSQDALASTRKIHEPVTRNAEIWDSFDGITYQKGAGVLAMTENYVGQKAFQDGVRLHLNRFAFKTATADDFFASLAEGSGHPEVVASLRSFIDQPHAPRINVRLECTGGKALLHLRQSTYAPLGSAIKGGEKWDIPFCASGSSEGKPFKACMMMTRENETLDLGQGCPAYVMPNAGGAGYYRFALDDAGWKALAAHANALPASEALALRDSASASLHAGAMQADNWFGMMEKLAAHPAWDVVSATAGAVAGLQGDALPYDDPALAAYVRKLFAPRYAAISGNSRGDKLLRTALKSRLALTGKDPVIRKPLVRAAEKFVGLHGKKDRAALAQSDMGIAFAAAVQDDGKPFADSLRTLLQSEHNPAIRGAAIGALGATRDPALAAELREWALGDTLSGREATGLIGALMRGPLAEEGWEWFTAHFDDVLARIPDVRKSAMPGFARGFCSFDKRDEVASFFKAQADKIPGYERSLAQTLESISLCAAFHEAKSAEVAQALKSRL